MSDELTILTTEHLALQGARQGCLQDMQGRSSLFVTSVSGTLVAIGFLGSAARFGAPFTAAVTVLLAALWVLGFLTFVRVVEIALEDSVLIFGMARIRHRFTQIAPETAQLFVRSIHDDYAGMIAEERVSERWWQVLMGSGTLVSFVTSVVAGAEVAFVCDALFHASLFVSIVAGFVSGVINLAAFSILSVQFWRRVNDRFQPLFPTQTT